MTISTKKISSKTNTGKNKCKIPSLSDADYHDKDKINARFNHHKLCMKTKSICRGMNGCHYMLFQTFFKTSTGTIINLSHLLTLKSYPELTQSLFGLCQDVLISRSKTSISSFQMLYKISHIGRSFYQLINKLYDFTAE